MTQDDRDDQDDQDKTGSAKINQENFFEEQICCAANMGEFC